MYYNILTMHGPMNVKYMWQLNSWLLKPINMSISLWYAAQPLESWSGPRGVILFHRDDFEMVESRALVAPRRQGFAVYSSDAIVADVQWCGHAYTGVLWFYRNPPCAVPRTQAKQLFIGLVCTSHNQHANISPIWVQIIVVRNCGIASREI
jgi:hypothetical protein